MNVCSPILTLRRISRPIALWLLNWETWRNFKQKRCCSGNKKRGLVVLSQPPRHPSSFSFLFFFFMFFVHSYAHSRVITSFVLILQSNIAKLFYSEIWDGRWLNKNQPCFHLKLFFWGGGGRSESADFFLSLVKRRRPSFFSPIKNKNAGQYKRKRRKKKGRAIQNDRGGGRNKKMRKSKRINYNLSGVVYTRREAPLTLPAIGLFSSCTLTTFLNFVLSPLPPSGQEKMDSDFFKSPPPPCYYFQSTPQIRSWLWLSISCVFYFFFFLLLLHPRHEIVIISAVLFS